MDSTINVRFNKSDLNMLLIFSEATNEPVGYHIRHAVKEYIEKYKDDETMKEKIKKARERMREVWDI